MANLRISDRQRRYLAGATRDPSEATRYLYQLIEDKEQLSPEWIDVWKRAKPLGLHYPDEIVTKIEQALGEISLVDDQIFKIRLEANQKVTLLLGAGASAPAIPTVADLLPELWRRAKKMGRDDIDQLAGWCDSQRITDIEDLLTAAHVADFAAKNPSVVGLLDYFLFTGRSSPSPASSFYSSSGRSTTRTIAVNVSSIALIQDTLHVLFGLLAGIMIPAAPNAGHQAIADFVTIHDNTSIVTTNYDGCIDEALIGGGVATDTHVQRKLASTAGRRPAIDLIKMHGSINWTYCDSCQEVKQFDLLKIKTQYDSDAASYAVIGICRACGGQRRPLLVPPLAFKFIVFPNLIGLWDIAAQRIENSDYLIVVGHSFSEADAYISKIISRSLTVNSQQKMIVCDLNPRLVPLLRDRFEAHIDRFDPMRVLQATGASADLLPRILASLTAKIAAPSAPVSPTTSPPPARRARTQSRPAPHGRSTVPLQD